MFLVRPITVLALFLVVALSSMTPIHAAGPGEDPPRTDLSWPASLLSDPLNGLTFAQAIHPYTPIYASPSDPGAGLAPARALSNGFVFLSLAGLQTENVGGESWYHLRRDGYVPARYLAPYRPSLFHGLRWYLPPSKPFAWVVWDTPLSATPGVAAAKGAAVLPRYQFVTLQEEQRINGSLWYRVGDGEWISQYRLGVVKPSPRPREVGPEEKWIEVNLFEQTVAAYEGDNLVYASLVSSGLPGWDTATGLFRVWAKVKVHPMTGREGAPDYYYLEDVPWTLYFNRDTALHAAYWHDGFGSVHSHGCVNLAPEDALRLYRWATPIESPATWTLSTRDNPGTWVWVHF